MECKIASIAIKRQQKNAETFKDVEIVEEIHKQNSVHENCKNSGLCCLHDIKNNTIISNTLQMTSLSTYEVGS